MSEKKTVIFGLDGACFDLIRPWLGDGHLPVLSALIERGGYSELASCVPATTPPAWSSLTTGVNPGKHGVFGFYRRQRETYDIAPVSDRDVHARRLWDYTTEADLTSLVVNVPVTHPGRELDGALIPGYLAPDHPPTYPQSVLDDMGLSDYRVYAPSEAEDVPEEQLLEEWLSLTESRANVATGLMDRYDWDVLFVEFQKTDGAVHKFDDQQNVRRIFERVDACMSTVLDAVEDPNVFVVSDHGIGQKKTWSVALNTWLVEEGYATTTVAEKEKESWLKTATETNGGSMDENQDIVQRLLAGLSTVGLTKQRIERALSTLGLYTLATRLAPEGAGDGLAEEVIDKPNSRAFYEGIGFSGVDVGVVLNDARFYQEGNVTAAEYGSLRDELIDRLRSLTGPDGERAFDSVRRREDVYTGELTDTAPDIILEQASQYVIGSQYPRGEPFIRAEPGRIDHTRNGLLVAAGPDIKADWHLENTPSIVDTTPTLLHLLDIPLNTRFDGEALTSLFDLDRKPTRMAYDPYQPPGHGARDATEEAALEERLKTMGYLE